MGNTYQQIYIQIIFAVYKRQNLIPEKHRREIEQYIGGILKKKGVKQLAIYCNPDHCHLFVGLLPTVRISDLVRDVKNNSSRFINHELYGMAGFSWQSGYGAFSYAKSQVKTVYNYVMNQREHHKKQTFKNEYIAFLDRFEIDYDEKYLFEWHD